jgi:hypothetical protein
MAKKTIANFESGTVEDISVDMTSEEVSHNMSDPDVETNMNDGAAATITIKTSLSKKKRSNNILARFGFRQKRSKNKAASSSESEATPLLETKISPLVSFSKDEEMQSKQSVSSRLTSTSSWNKVKVRLSDGDFLLQGASQEPPSTTANNDKRGRVSMVEEAMGEIRSGMEFSSTYCLIAIFIYLILAIICYHTTFQPEWTIIDACYFAVTTFTTVGYGDLTPTTEASMMFTCLYALTGVACLGIALGILGSNLIDAQEKALSTAGELSRYQVLSAFDASQSGEGNQFQEQQKKVQEQAPQDSASGTYLIFLLHAIPLVCVLLGLAFWIGKESGWDTPETIYYLVITGTKHANIKAV